jgi:flagellar motor switch protein FliN
MSDDALIRLGESTSEAVTGILEMFAPGKVVPGDVAVVSADESPLVNIPVPAVSTSVAYVDGVTGGNLFVMTLDGAKLLAAAMMGMEAPEDPDSPELSELELSAVSEAMNQMMASAAGAISAVLGTEVEIGTPETNIFTSAEDAVDAYPQTPHAIRAGFTVCGQPCRLVQLVPNAFVIRMSSALDDLSTEVPAPGADVSGAASSGGSAVASGPVTPSLSGIPVRVWAELGRARMPSAEVVGLPPGAVVELNTAADEPIDLYVNGRRFAKGRLVVVDGTDWAVRIEHVFASTNSEMENRMEVARWPESW